MYGRRRCSYYGDEKATALRQLKDEGKTDAYKAELKKMETELAMTHGEDKAKQMISNFDQVISDKSVNLEVYLKDALSEKTNQDESAVNAMENEDDNEQNLANLNDEEEVANEN
uniref:Uncharacterized protein n=1 Tax=Ciona savignyi TaxID=51511 RepID=H2Z290_CIOSA